MEPWSAFVHRQRTQQFSDFTGASLSVSLPLPDRVITDLIKPLLPAAISHCDLRAKAGNLLLVGLRVRRPSWLPQINLELRIEAQPELPHSPVLVVRQLSHGGLAALAGAAASFRSVLPPWLRVDGALIFVDIAALLRQRDAVDLLTYVQRLEVTTREGVIVIATDVRIP